MTKEEKIKAIIEMQMKLDAPLLIDEDRMITVDKQLNIIHIHRVTLLMYCQDYKQSIQQYKDKQAIHIQNLSDNNLCLYCTHNNLKTHNDTELISCIMHIKSQYNNLQNQYQIGHQLLLSILLPNKKYLNQDLKRLFNLQSFIDNYNINLMDNIRTCLYRQWNLYVVNLKLKYQNMKNEEIDRLYTSYAFMCKVL